MPKISADVQKTREGKFLGGVYILTLSTVIVKIIGLVYKIPMLKLLGSEGMGYFNSAYEIYAAFCIVATSGLPVAMSILVSSARDERHRRRIFSVSLFVFFCLGLLCMATILGLAYPFSVFLGSPQTYVSLLCISPAILFICLCSAVRGYFQGLGQMSPTALSQVIEASGKLTFGLCFAWLGIRAGLEIYQIAGLAVLGLTLAELIAMCVLFASKKKFPKQEKDNLADRKIFKGLMHTAIPITFSSSVLGITRLIDMTMIFRRLRHIGYTGNLINSIYGSYTTLAIPLFGLAPALVTAVALPLIPAISSARAEENVELQNEVAHRALKLTSLIGAPVGAGLCIFSTPILRLIFGDETEAIAYASPLLSILGTSVLLSCFITVQNSLLQAYGKPALPIASMAVGAGVKIILCYLLVGNESIHMYGIPIGTFVCDFIISTLNFYFLCKHTPLSFKLKEVILKPYVCGISASAMAYKVFTAVGKNVQNTSLRTLLAVALAALIYVVLLFITRTMNNKEMQILLLKNRKNKEKNI